MRLVAARRGAVRCVVWLRMVDNERGMEVLRCLFMYMTVREWVWAAVRKKRLGWLMSVPGIGPLLFPPVGSRCWTAVLQGCRKAVVLRSWPECLRSRT